MSRIILASGYKIAQTFYTFVNQEVLPTLAVESRYFWQSFSDILDEFTAQNKALLDTRDHLQAQIDTWHLEQKGRPIEQQVYRNFLSKIGYLVDQKEDFCITTSQVDPEVAQLAGPQLVVPLINARFALNAANARWGSLYDALYSADIIDEAIDDQRTQAQPIQRPTTTISQKTYNPVRGALVQAYAKAFLDSAVPLENANQHPVSHKDVADYSIVNRQLVVRLKSNLDSSHSGRLKNPQQLVGYTGDPSKPHCVLLVNHGLHIEIQIDPQSVVAQNDNASVKDIILEAALTTIQDCEDSIAAVDTEDKILVYRNWLGLMTGKLTASFMKNGKKQIRQLNPDRNYLSPSGESFSLAGRSLQFIRNVGHLMTSDLILTQDDQEVPEGIVDTVITSVIALHNHSSRLKNSQTNSIYIVKPKMHGPAEVKFCEQLFSRVEQKLNLPQNTIKMGIMDEERRTSANLKECIRAAKNRVAFINTGFLDRTGDEIHTSMQAGAVAQKERMKNEKWISVYENRNVRIGLQAGFKNRAQIGKGMWATPDQMRAMMVQKIAHLEAGANCAWVPSPTAAILHAMHYHQINVGQIQNQLLDTYDKQSDNDDLDDLLRIPLLQNSNALSSQEIQNELDNNVQGLLGYVVRWIDQGIGCSTVPDINHVGRMEDRATLRISSQHICNWLYHGLLTEEQVMNSLHKMARVVDRQNAADPNYRPMAGKMEKGVAFQAAKDLIFKGKEQPNGYTEPLLHQKRKEAKEKATQ